MTEKSKEVKDLWDRYQEAGDPEIREQLIINYAPLVKFVAGRVGSGLPHNIEHSDLASYGVFGLIDAIDKFDPGRGFKFETYAISRIKGAILDELRAIDWVPRSVRAKGRSYERAYSKLENELRRAPDEQELAEELDMTATEFRHGMSQISWTSTVGLDDPMSEFEGSATIGDTVADRSVDSTELFEIKQMRISLADAISGMADRERLVLTLYYYEDLTLAQIGVILGVTESRVCQIHSKALNHLRNQLHSSAA